LNAPFENFLFYAFPERKKKQNKVDSFFVNKTPVNSLKKKEKSCSFVFRFFFSFRGNKKISIVKLIHNLCAGCTVEHILFLESVKLKAFL